MLAASLAIKNGRPCAGWRSNQRPPSPGCPAASARSARQAGQQPPEPCVGLVGGESGRNPQPIRRGCDWCYATAGDMAACWSPMRGRPPTSVMPATMCSTSTSWPRTALQQGPVTPDHGLGCRFMERVPIRRAAGAPLAWPGHQGSAVVEHTALRRLSAAVLR